MTDEIFNQGRKLKDSIKEIDDVLYSITPYLHNDIEITVQKKIYNCNNGEKLHYRLRYDSPLWIAIESSLKDMRSDFQKQFDELNCNSKEEMKTPIKKSWWKIWKK